MTYTDRDIENAYDSMIECALWSSLVYDESGERCEPADDHFDESDIPEDVRAELRSDIEAFMGNHEVDLVGLTPVQIGHDFWLTREGHGTGFWDRGLGEQGARLTVAAHAYGEFDLQLPAIPEEDD